MPEFIVRARAAPASPDAFRAAVGHDRGVEYLADIIKAGLLLSQGHRVETVVHLVLEKSQDFSRVVTFDGHELGGLPGMQEEQLLEVIADALTPASGLSKDQRIVDERGVAVTTTSFEHLVKRKAEVQDTFVLKPNGEDIRLLDLPHDSVFVLTDHTPMPKKTFKSMARQGIRPVSVGPRMLHAAHCIAIILNEIDRR